MNQLESLKDFHHEFSSNGKNYKAHIQHYDVLSQDEIIDYKVVEGELLVQLYSDEGCQTFKVLMDDKSIKQTDSSRIAIDPHMIETIGLIIDMENEPWL
jgi:hypothetical protein